MKRRNFFKALSITPLVAIIPKEKVDFDKYCSNFSVKGDSDWRNNSTTASPIEPSDFVLNSWDIHIDGEKIDALALDDIRQSWKNKPPHEIIRDINRALLCENK